MKIEVDIPESIYDTIQADQMISREQLAVLQMHILNGTPLPTDAVDRVTIKEYLDSFGKDINVTATDCISRQAVLDYIYNDLGLGDEENGKDAERQMELESSYRYVKSLPPVTPQHCEDCISREDLLKKCVYAPIAPVIKGDSVHYEDIVFARDIINAESIKQEQKTGHWIMHGNHRECSKCKVWFPKDMPRNSYCPNCGSKM